MTASAPVDFQDVLRTAVDAAGGIRLFAKLAGVSILAVWHALDDREPHHKLLVTLGLEREVTYRRT